MFLPLILTFFFIFSLSFGCSPTVKDQEKPLILDKDTLQIAEDKKTLQGTGRVLFKTPLLGLYSKEMYLIKAQLFHENSSLILYSHFSGFAQQDGIKIFFIRGQLPPPAPQNFTTSGLFSPFVKLKKKDTVRDKNSLIIKASTTSYPTQTLYTDPDYFIKNQNLEVYIEVQNGTDNFISIKIWDAYTNPSGYVKEPMRFLSQQNLIVNSSDFLFYSKGQGMLWGVQLNKVRLNSTSREPVNQ